MITNDSVLKADSQRLTMTARALNSLKRFRDNSVGNVRRREIKTWLGLRYDRPAVPVPFDRMALEILYPIIFHAMPPSLKGKVRDVLVYYESQSEIRLSVILRDGDDRSVCLDWIDEVAERLIVDYGIVVIERQVEDASRTPFSVIETYYGLDSAELSLTPTPIMSD